jgi:hypothetical protein
MVDKLCRMSGLLSRHPDSVVNRRFGLNPLEVGLQPSGCLVHVIGCLDSVEIPRFFQKPHWTKRIYLKSA